ncbi:MAG: hypothetical protein QNJ12_16305 [Ilumatobacter sp.]|uniref:hypothetical protein n=1 Tax=Ilumatobacter sp. TaxID=1967498 RepID=UPI0026073F81|nr:hypothetical protein [Ilumatobacter sp.]MDJ0770359.1 hypothetical protein [Ilumatobacter sp.]
MIENELTELRRANPVTVDAATDLVAEHRSALAAAIGERRAASPRDRAAVRERAAGRPARVSLIGAVAAAAVVLALPALLLTTATRTGGDIPDAPSHDRPTPDELPRPADLGSPDDSSISAPTTARPVITSSIPPRSSVEPRDGAEARPPVPPIVSTSPQPQPPASTVPPTETTPPVPRESSPATDPPSTATSSTPPAPTVPPTTTTDPAAGGTGEHTPGNTAGQPFDPAVDLLVITFDFANRDDGHASVAARELATSLDLDPLVVAGTSAPDSTWFVQEYTDVMSAAWGSDWLDAATDRPGAVARAADRWLLTIDAGGVVRVAEGGVSDFTADVLRELRDRRPGLDTTSVVQVVHHNGRNEDETRSGDLDVVRTSTSYVRIDDGNSENDTADLNGATATFESTALAGRHGDAWTVAFDYLAAESLDFSDTVTALHVLGVAKDEVSEPDGFAARFMRVPGPG